MRLILNLIDADFFKVPQELGAVRTALEAQGHFYPTTSLSPLMLRLGYPLTEPSRSANDSSELEKLMTGTRL